MASSSGPSTPAGGGHSNLGESSLHDQDSTVRAQPLSWVDSVRSAIIPSSSSNLLVDLAPQLLQTNILNSHHFTTRSLHASFGSSSSSLTKPGIREMLGWRTARVDSNSVYIREKVDDLCRMDVPKAPFEFTSSSSSTFKSSKSVKPLSESENLQLEYPGQDDKIPLFRGFLATTTAAQSARLERRRKRAVLGEKTLGMAERGIIGLKERADGARGMLGNAKDDISPLDGSMGHLNINRRAFGAPKRASRRQSEFSKLGVSDQRGGLLRLGVAGEAETESIEQETPMEELQKDVLAVQQDMSNVAVRRALYHDQITEIEVKVAELDAVRESLRRDLLRLREEELELEDELQGAHDRIMVKNERKNGRVVSVSSRRRKGPAFLPSEHDELPVGIAFMTLHGHSAPLTSLDFSEPYGIAVSASVDESVRLWDLTTGDAAGFLRGHRGIVKVLQVESSTCVTGGVDGQIRIWDLNLAEAALPTSLSSPSINAEHLDPPNSLENVLLGTSNEVFGDSGVGGAGLVNGMASEEGMMREEGYTAATAAVLSGDEKGIGPCQKTLDGHTKAVTSLYFDGSCLVTGSSDSTLRQWDLHTGQCVLTMDILWAISNPMASQTLSSDDSGTTADYASPNPSPRKSLTALRRQSSNFITSGGAAGLGFGTNPTTKTYADGSWDIYEDFVGGVQFWGYALASGTGDGCVRMWDMRTGQAHRTLVGHTGPVTCVQFDELHLVSGSLDKSIRIWDLRTGSISDTIRYEHPITSLQFDSRKIIAAAGDNGVRVYNRTTLQHSALSVNGHTSPVEKLRFMDKYLATGGRDCTVKVWALP